MRIRVERGHRLELCRVLPGRPWRFVVGRADSVVDRRPLDAAEQRIDLHCEPEPRPGHGDDDPSPIALVAALHHVPQLRQARKSRRDRGPRPPQQPRDLPQRDLARPRHGVEHQPRREIDARLAVRLAHVAGNGRLRLCHRHQRVLVCRPHRQGIHLRRGRDSLVQPFAKDPPPSRPLEPIVHRILVE